MVLWVLRPIIRSDVGRHLDLCLKIIIGYLLLEAGKATWLVGFGQVFFDPCTHIVIAIVVPLSG